jgi:hypothetical protein
MVKVLGEVCSISPSKLESLRIWVVNVCGVLLPLPPPHPERLRIPQAMAITGIRACMIAGSLFWRGVCAFATVNHYTYAT